MPITFAPTLDQFRAVATERVCQTATLRFNTAGTGFAVTRWQRFQVSVCDLFRTETVAARKAQVLTAFLDAVHEERGVFSRHLAESEFQTGGQTQKLSSRAVTATINRLNETWVHNERVIHQAAYGVPGKGIRNMPSLAELVDPIASKIMEDAEASGLLKNAELESLQKKYIGTTPRLPHQLITAPINRLSEAIEKGVREKFREKSESTGNAHPTLSADEIAAKSKAAVRTALTREVNRIAYRNACKTEPFDQAFQTVMENSQLSPQAKKTLGSMRDAFRHLEAQSAQTQASVLSTKTMQTLRTQRLEHIVTHAGPLEHLAKLGVADGPLKTSMIESCLQLSPTTGETYFTQVETFAQEIALSLPQMQGSQPEAREEALLALAETMQQRLGESGFKTADAEDFGNLAALGITLFAARANLQTRQDLGQWLQSPTAKVLGKTMIDHCTQIAADKNPTLARNANLASLLLVSLSRAADEADAGPAAPTTAPSAMRV